MLADGQILKNANVHCCGIVAVRCSLVAREGLVVAVSGSTVIISNEMKSTR